MKPNWINAPTWANWLAQDKEGIWNWFENRPEANGFNVTDGTWKALGQSENASYNENWEKTLDPRPNPLLHEEEK